MKLPAVCITAAFAGGVALGLFSPLARYCTSSAIVLATFVCVPILLALSLFLLRRALVTSAMSISLGAWLVLGVLSAWCASQPAPADQVLNLASSARIDLSTPLRWHAHLRDEPAQHPWGTSYDLALDAVEFEGITLATTGGLRLTYSPRGDAAQIVQLHVGDGVAFVAQAHLPQVFRDEGAFDRRAYLQQQGVDLTATLRSASLMEKETSSSFSIKNSLSRTRSALRNELNTLFPDSPQVAGVLRAMLLGDRSFVDRDESVAFQKTGVFHVLVVAGLHVGAFAVFLYWLGRKCRVSIGWTTLFLLLALTSYIALIEQRPPVLRASLMAAVLLTGGYFFRRLELLNSAAIAALILLVAQPLELRDSSFQLSFLSIGCIAGIAVPWMDRSVEPYVRGLRAWRDITRDAAHTPRVIQFRIDLRSVIAWFTAKTSSLRAKFFGDAFVFSLRAAFRIWELIFLTLVLQIGMSPLMALNFHRVTLLGALANLLAVPLTGILVPFGFVILMIGALSTTVASWLAVPLRFLTAFLIHSVDWFSHLAHGSYRVPGPPIWLIAMFFVFIVVLSVLLRIEWQRSRLFAGLATFSLLSATMLIALHPFASQFAKGKLEFTVLDVGQGDSLLLVSPAGHTLLIDAGGPPPTYGGHESQRAVDPGEEAVSPYLWSRGFKKIDIVALTHAHQDHLGGLPAILENFQVGALWIGREVQTPALQQLEALAVSRRIPIVHEAQGQTFGLDGAKGKVLWPEPGSGDATSARNNDSLVIHLQFRNRSFLLPGDAETQAESAILAENAENSLHSDVLKVGHHGSKNSTTLELLAAVQPQWAVISSGAENPYGHPSRDLLQRLEDAHVKILRTDRNGAIHILTDGDRLEISCFVECGQIVAQQTSATAQIPNH
ncbi:MAG TPA: DNA internalization-related competence protein ComEC/Rec2 [Candidatus Dormibacteraeota bacterium]|nr:DNA internalization-related competence protein ComEC/Rec2 [Candidatus Dormibacteraeota bacterium]